MRPNHVWIANPENLFHFEVFKSNWFLVELIIRIHKFILSWSKCKSCLINKKGGIHRDWDSSNNIYLKKWLVYNMRYQIYDYNNNGVIINC